MCKWPLVAAACWKRETSEKNENHEKYLVKIMYRQAWYRQLCAGVNEDLTKVQAARCGSHVLKKNHEKSRENDVRMI